MDYHPKNKDSKKYVEICRDLDPGEASSIILALENPGCLLVIDEKKGRHIAKELRIEIIGTLRVILLAKEKGIIPSIREVLEKLAHNNFRVDKRITTVLLKAANEL
jgi:uncharacterized protein